MNTQPIMRALACLLLLGGLAACTTPAPPRPAMQPLAVAGSFGFSDRAIDADTIEITYRGAQISVDSRSARNDTRLEAEKLKVRDLALLRGAKLAQEKGASGFLVVSERVDSDVDVRSNPSCRPSPYWGPWGYRPYYGYGYGHGFGYGWPGPYNCYENRWAKAQATAVLTLDLVQAGAPENAAVQAVAPTIARLEKLYAGATYP
jgi:hypothetical protein